MYLGKKVRVFLKDQAKECYSKLNRLSTKEKRIITKSIDRTINILKSNPQFGNPLSKNLIPEVFVTHGIQNLYRVKLSNYWRLLYTIESDGKNIFIFIVLICNHKDYNKFMGYKSKS